MKGDSQGNSVENRKTAPWTPFNQCGAEPGSSAPIQWGGHYELETCRDLGDGSRRHTHMWKIQMQIHTHSHSIHPSPSVIPPFLFRLYQPVLALNRSAEGLSIVRCPRDWVWHLVCSVPFPVIISCLFYSGSTTITGVSAQTGRLMRKGWFFWRAENGPGFWFWLYSWLASG